MKQFSKLLLVALLCINSLLTKAQQGDTLVIQRSEKGKISFARFKPDVNRKIQDAGGFLKAVLHAKPDDELRLIKETIDKLGISHRIYQQYYKGVKVENAEYLIHGKNGIIETINGDFQEVNISSVLPTVNERQALSKALNFVNAQKYKWQDANLEKFIKQNTNNPNATYYPKGEIVITKDLLKGGNNLRLTWKFTISSLVPNNEQEIYVDAVTNEVIRETPLIYDVNTPCTAQTRYSGTLGITGDSFAGGFRLRENRNGVDVQTLNLQNTMNYATAIDFTNTNTDFINGNWANFNQDQAALDAHWGAENVLDYWRVVHNRNSINGSGMAVVSYVHNSIGNNAYWDATARVMNYGDGDGIIFNPLTALDICAHEIGHGIAQFTAALNPGTQESGALNEGFSDIWGACVENRSAPTKQTWLIGEEIFATTAFNCIRDLQNPNSTTAAEGQHPDTYHGNFWDNNGEPHNNSTVLSHWFFLLSQGGSGTNDIGNAFTVNGIGINDAQLIAFRAESMYLNSTANYGDARNTTIQAARDLFGACSNQEAAVTDAWFAVGVGDAFVAIPSINFVSFSNPNGNPYGWCSNMYGNEFNIQCTDPSAYFDYEIRSWPSMNLVSSGQSGSTGTVGYLSQGFYVFRARPNGQCGVGNWYETEVDNFECNSGGGEENFRILASPNPTDGDLNIKITDEKPDVKSLSKTEKVLYQLYDINRTSLVKQWVFDNYQNQQRLNVRGLKTGQYVLVVTKGKYRQSKHIIIN